MLLMKRTERKKTESYPSQRNCLLNRLRRSCILFVMGSYTETIQCLCTFSYYINESSDYILVQIVYVHVTVDLNSFAMSTVI